MWDLSQGVGLERGMRDRTAETNDLLNAVIECERE